MPVYDRFAAVRCAHTWAYARDPRYYDFSLLGGDCTNFASQCLFAGARVMDFTPTFGWYYRSLGDRAPAWTGVQYLYNYLTRSRVSPGPTAREAAIGEMEPGDLVQLSFDGVRFTHCPIAVSVGAHTPETLLLAAHSEDCDDRPLASYDFRAVRFLHITGVIGA